MGTGWATRSRSCAEEYPGPTHALYRMIRSADTFPEVGGPNRSTPLLSPAPHARSYSRAKHGFDSPVGIFASWLENVPTTPAEVTFTLSA